MDRRLKQLMWMYLIAFALVFFSLVVWVQAAHAFHGCDNNEGECDNSPTVYICIQEGSCHFDGEGKRKSVQPCPPIGVPPALPHCDPAP